MFVFFALSAAKAENSVVVESKTLPAGQRNATIGVHLTNEVALSGISLPLEFREVTAGSYLASKPRFDQNPSGRYCNSPLGACPSPNWIIQAKTSRFFAVPASNWDCSGPLSHTYWLGSNSFDSLSPDACLYATVSGGCPDCGLYPLEPGSDPAGTENASFVFRFDVTSVPGQFEIDTCCVQPAVHLMFEAINTGPIVPAFTKGLVTTVTCTCPCAADPVCDSAHDISDVSTLIDIAFRGVPDVSDSTCRVSRTDVNADGQTDVVDVVRMILVVFMGQPAETDFVNPCP
jgi:hypothetical protein